ncbi:MAG: hypothetical protein QM731_07045 [Chitinophagaceae bacterium]
MAKLLSIVLILTTTFYSCSDPMATDSNQVTSIPKTYITKYKGLHGTWVRQNKAGFTLIEIKDTLHVLYYQFLNREKDLGKAANDKYWYYKSEATMGYRDSSTIWISTDKFRFDYELKGDTLIESDKMGEQGIFVKVQTDEEKNFKDFNAANLKGKITYLTKVDSSEFFVLDNIDWEYSFTSIASNTLNNKIFSDIAAIGDSIVKPSFSDTLTLFKRDGKQYFQFAFVRR